MTPARGVPLSAEHRAALLRAHKGKPLTEEHKAKISAARLGQVNGPEARARMSASHTGKKRSEEMKQSIRAAIRAWRTATAPARDAAFWAKVRIGDPGECWPWLGKLSPQGYGRHRRAYILTHGSIPPGHHIDHLCHDYKVCSLGDACPHRSCVNPAHLQAVSPSLNAKRSGAKRNLISFAD